MFHNQLIIDSMEVTTMDIVPKFLDEALTPVAKELGQRLADLVSLAFTPIIKLKGKGIINLKFFCRT